MYTSVRFLGSWIMEKKETMVCIVSFFTSTRTSFCEERIGRSLGLLLLSTDSVCGM